MFTARLYCCTNPYCTSTRLFKLEEIQGHKKCNAWIITPNHKTTQKQQIPQQIISQESYNFQQLGLHSIYKIYNKLTNWPDQLNKIFELMKNRICQQIDSMKNKKISQFYILYQQVIHAITQIQAIATKLAQDSTNQECYGMDLQMNYFKKVIGYGGINLCQTQRIQYYFQNNIPMYLENISNLIQSYGVNYRQIQQKRKKIGLQKTNQYFLDNDIIQNDKIQKLTTLFKTQMVKITHDQQLSTFKTNCWLCQVTCYSNGSTKKGCLQQLLTHLMQIHSKQIYLNFMNRVLRYDVEQISFHSLRSRIETEKIREFYVIDRQNAGTIQKPLQIQPDKLWIQVVNKDNKNLPKGQFAVADSTRKDAADILITVLIYEMVKFNGGKVTLVTKDHFGITLQQVLGSLYPQKIVCMVPKDFMDMLENKKDVNNGEMKDEAKK